MKLASWSDLVKPDRAALAAAAATAFAGLLLGMLVLVATDRQPQRLDHFGTAMANAMAELTVEAMMREDRMHLSVIGNRLAELPEVAGAASYDAGERLLATTGSLPQPHFDAPVTVDGSVIGFARVAIDADAFAGTHPAQLPLLLAVALLLPLLVASATTLLRALEAGEIRPPRRGAVRFGGHGSAADDADEDSTDVAEPAPPAAMRHYLLAVNLYNQLSLQPTEREFELSLCTELAESVVDMYQGQVVSLPGVGVLLDFDHTDDADRPFQVLEAALLLARLLRDEAPFGVYRLGLNLVELPSDRPLPLDDDAVSDAALLSALAKDLTLAVSAPCLEALGDDDRLHLHPLVNPLLDELTTSSPACALVTGLAAEEAATLLQIVARLRDQRDAIANPSTR